MEKEKEDILLKSRSSRACIADGFRLYLGQFKRIFRYTWVVALVFAVVNGLFGTYYVTENPQLVVAMESGSPDWSLLASGMMVALAVGSLLLLLAFCLFAGHVFSMLGAHKATGEMPWAPKVLHFDRKATWRTLKAVLWALFFAAVAVFAVSLLTTLSITVLSSSATLILGLLLTVVVAVLFVPFHYVFYKYLLTPGLSFIPTLPSGYATGLRHLGTLLAVVIVTSMVVGVVSLLTSLPMSILYMANLRAYMGQMLGDPLGMPDYMLRLTAAVFVLASFMQAYVLMAIAFPLYYAYGSIEASEDERSKAMKNIEKEDK